MRQQSKLWIAAGLSLAAFAGPALAQGHDPAMGRNLDQIEFAPTPGLPDCARNAVLSGDPTKEPSIILAKIASGCTVPWHWHTPNEHLMMVSGAARIETKGAKPIVLKAGGFAKLAGRHVHRFRCTSDCVMYVQAEGPFDIHYVDERGMEIAPEAALKTTQTARQR